MTFLLTVDSLSKTFKGRVVFKDLSFEVSEGDRALVIGPNGAGKTTLIRILNLLETPTKGEVYFNGENVQEIKEKWAFRRRMAVVFQNPSVLNTSVYENIAVGLKIRGEKRESITRKVNDALKTFGLSRIEEKNAKTLSGGEKQLLALARAVVLEPELLLLDEPTSNLDPENTALVIEVVKNTASTVIITSLRDSVVKLANKTIYLGRGEEGAD